MKAIVTLYIMQVIAKFIWYSIAILTGGFLLIVIILALYQVIKERIEREKERAKIKKEIL